MGVAAVPVAVVESHGPRLPIQFRGAPRRQDAPAAAAVTTYNRERPMWRSARRLLSCGRAESRPDFPLRSHNGLTQQTDPHDHASKGCGWQHLVGLGWPLSSLAYVWALQG